MKKYYTLLFLLSFSCIVFSQDVIGNEPQENKSFLKEASTLPVEGYYQVVLAHKDIIVDIPEATLRQIDSKRHQEDVTYLVVNEYVKIRILPFKTIRNKNFVPLKKYSYEN